jgi:hypothetical protein
MREFTPRSFHLTSSQERERTGIVHLYLNIQIAYPPVEGKVPAKKKAAKKGKKK